MSGWLCSLPYDRLFPACSAHVGISRSCMVPHALSFSTICTWSYQKCSRVSAISVHVYLNISKFSITLHRSITYARSFLIYSCEQRLSRFFFRFRKVRNLGVAVANEYAKLWTQEAKSGDRGLLRLPPEPGNELDLPEIPFSRDTNMVMLTLSQMDHVRAKIVRRSTGLRVNDVSHEFDEPSDWESP